MSQAVQGLVSTLRCVASVPHWAYSVQPNISKYFDFLWHLLRISTPFPEQLSRLKRFFRLVGRGMMALYSAFDVSSRAKRSSALMNDTIMFSKPYWERTSTKGFEVAAAGGEILGCRLKERTLVISHDRLRFSVRVAVELQWLGDPSFWRMVALMDDWRGIGCRELLKIWGERNFGDGMEQAEKWRR
jgi:hypothetical protein